MMPSKKTVTTMVNTSLPINYLIKTSQSTFKQNTQKNLFPLTEISFLKYKKS